MEPQGMSARDLSQSDLLEGAYAAEIARTIERQRSLEHENHELRLEVKRLTRLAYRDALTGLANRRLLESTLDSEIRRASRAATSLTLLLCDVDHFKRYNDTFGHERGDDVLRLVGASIERCCRRAGEMGARYGGEEFAVVLPGIDIADALVVAERLRRDVAALTFDWSACHPNLGRITISVGATTFRSPLPCSAADLINAADYALYRAKGTGRNRVHFAPISSYRPDERA
jgi:two-component system, chemotaxis family, response regulator WspR